MKIRTKLIGGFVIVAIIGGILGAIGLYSNRTLTASTEALLELSKSGERVSSILSAHYNWMHALSQSVYSDAPFSASLDPNTCALGSWLNSAEVRHISDKEVLALLQKVQEPHNFIHLEARAIINYLNNGENEAAVKLFREDVLPNTQEVIADLTKINDRYSVMLNNRTQEIYDLGGVFSVIIAAFIVTALVVSVILGLIITSTIVKPLKSVTATLRDISEGDGDLTKRIHNNSGDEVGDLSRYFNQTLEKIKALVISIKKEAANLSDTGSDLASNMNQAATAINQITASIQSIKARVINQSASVTETNATMEQVTTNISRLNGHVENQSNYISLASAAIEQMVANIQSVTDTLAKNSGNMQTLKEASNTGRAGIQDVASDIQEIASESEGLLEINAMMANIASQTNLLSMNAAIEAAHAGDAGKGFAVVADEIRKLAELSGEQSRTTGAVLKKIKESMDKITNSTENVLKKFAAIDSNVGIVAEQEESILCAMKEQGQGSKQVLDGIVLVTETTQHVKSGSSEMLLGAQEVIQESANLEIATQEITSGMNEMASGAEQINVAVDHVNQISNKNRDGIDILIKEVSRFKVA